MKTNVIDNYNRKAVAQYCVTTATLMGAACLAATLGHATMENVKETGLAIAKTLLAARLIGPAIIALATTPVKTNEGEPSKYDLHGKNDLIALDNFEQCKRAAGVDPKIQLRRFRKRDGLLSKLIPGFTTPYLNRPVIVLGRSALEDVSTPEQQAVFAHEMAHIKLHHFMLRRISLAGFIASAHMLRLPDIQHSLPTYAAVLANFGSLAVLSLSIKGTETQADMNAALITKKPFELRNALERVSGSDEGKTTRRWSPLYHLYGQHPHAWLRMRRLRECSLETPDKSTGIYDQTFKTVMTKLDSHIAQLKRQMDRPLP